MPNAPVIRKAMGGGRWFPGIREELLRAVNEYIEDAQVPPINGRIVGGMAPHAGYMYSGVVAGYTFSAIRANIQAGHVLDTVVVLGFSHCGGFDGAAIMDGDAIETPLGQLSLDREAAGILAGEAPCRALNYGPHAGEHSAENLLPFLQVAVPDARAVVCLIGDHAAGTLDDIVKALVRLNENRSVLVLASTDLLHDPDYERVTQTDHKTMDQVAALDYRGILSRWSYSAQVCCGIGPVMCTMRFADRLGVTAGNVLHYRNSGDDFPESRGSWVVGYGSAVFVKGD